MAWLIAAVQQTKLIGAASIVVVSADIVVLLSFGPCRPGAHRKTIEGDAKGLSFAKSEIVGKKEEEQGAKVKGDVGLPRMDA